MAGLQEFLYIGQKHPVMAIVFQVIWLLLSVKT